MTDEFENRQSSAGVQQLADDLTAVTWALARRLRVEGSQASELSLSQLSLLGHLERSPGLTSAQLAREERVTPQSMNTAVAELRKLGLLEARPVQSDGRRLALSLTPEGAHALEANRRQRSAWMVEFLAQEMTETERRTLADALSALRRASLSLRKRETPRS